MRFVIVRDEKHIPVELEEREGGYLVTLDGKAYEVESARILEGLYSLLIRRRELRGHGAPLKPRTL